MRENISLHDAERKAFRSTHNDGLLDILLGSFVLAFIMALYLSPILGDLWSSVAMVPAWGLVFLAAWLLRTRVVAPRLGTAKFGPARKRRLARFGLLLLAFNIVAFILGVVAALTFGRIPGIMVSVVFGMLLLAGFTLMAYFLDMGRLYVYGLLVGLSPLVGEWLWSMGMAPHHGLPLTFGVSGSIMVVVGLFQFIRVLRDSPLPDTDLD